MENNNGGHPLETGGRWTGIDGGARGGQDGEGRVRALWYAVEVVRMGRKKKEEDGGDVFHNPPNSQELFSPPARS